jgi:phospholipid/cholesterol/gamma-HCH transport system substrate-binding protein
MAIDLAHAAASASGTLDGAQQFTSETLPEVHKLVIELQDLTNSLRRFSGELEQNPSALLYGKPAAKRGPGE